MRTKIQSVLIGLCVAIAAPLHGQAAPARGPAFITLGTMGGPITSPVRSQPSNVLLQGDQAILVDVGDGTAEQLAKAGVALPRVTAVLISHLHWDHTGGLQAILGLRYQTQVAGKLAIFGPPGTRALVDGLVASMQPAAEAGYGLPGEPSTAPKDTVLVTEVTDGSTFKLGEVAVTVAQNTHYSFAPGGDPDKRFKSLSFRFDTPGRSIVYTGDTGPSTAVERLGRNADLLVSEMIDVAATVEAVRRNTPGMSPGAMAALTRHLSTHHLTPEQVGQMAARAGVKTVVVTHFVAPAASAQQIAGYRAEIAKAFPGKVVIADDLQRF